ncbi:TetR/AcrR family transcriptional regulator [Rothia halotolerans]|uniref:TetR/AcrR family transcriptional regulator n=1 Tax=Rothia halotolerans TaxID=405770 RepID=UPI00101BCCF5|nr:TetR/AcrR family transcriptional regulator [Rothia halotolerans]
MSSTSRAPHTAPETAERIRDTAITEFAARGFSSTTVRGIAAAASVSPGLVIHHFGSKAKLRAACDDHVFETLTDIKRENPQAPPSLLAELLTEGPMRTYVEYFLKSMLDPSGQGQRFFDHYVAVLEQIIGEGFAGYAFRQAEDRRAQSTAIAVLALSPMLLEPRVRHALGTEDLAGSLARLAPCLLDLYRHGFITSEPDRQDLSTPSAAPGGRHDAPPAGPEGEASTTNEGDQR